MQKVFISVPDNLFARMKALIPPKQRSKRDHWGGDQKETALRVNRSDPY